MAKIGRNDPCPCGSGKKYKHCCLPNDEAAQAEQLKLRRAADTLLPRLVEQARLHTTHIPDALARYWNSKYAPEQLTELDDLEDRGAERFLTWFAFDYHAEQAPSLAEALAAEPGTLTDADDAERSLLAGWATARLQPYMIETARKGQGLIARNLLTEAEIMIEDRAASRRLTQGDMLVTHLLPVGNTHIIGGAAAHLTPDTQAGLRAFAELHLESMRAAAPDADWAALVQSRSEIFNHFVMELPVEAPDPSIFDTILLKTRVALQMAGESLGLGGSKEEKKDTTDN